MNIVDTNFIYLNQQFDSREALLKKVAEDLQDAGRIQDVERFYQDILSREEEVSTYMGDGIAIPHCKTDNINTSTVILVRNAKPIPWNDEDEPADMIFILSVKDTKQGDDQSHLKVLSRLAQNIMDEDFMDEMKHEQNKTKIYETLKVVEGR
ncbi:MAG: PTS sugar transporter subunit IIA [Candidatus Izemoplasmataceae bacterium]